MDLLWLSHLLLRETLLIVLLDGQILFAIELYFKLVQTLVLWVYLILTVLVLEINLS